MNVASRGGCCTQWWGHMYICACKESGTGSTKWLISNSAVSTALLIGDGWVADYSTRQVLCFQSVLRQGLLNSLEPTSFCGDLPVQLLHGICSNKGNPSVRVWSNIANSYLFLFWKQRQGSWQIADNTCKQVFCAYFTSPCATRVTIGNDDLLHDGLDKRCRCGSAKQCSCEGGTMARDVAI